MTSTSGPAPNTFYCDIGADFVDEYLLPGDYSAATGLMHVRSETESGTIIATGAVTFGAYNAATDQTLMTLTIADTVTVDLEPRRAVADVRVDLAGLKEFWLRGDFVIRTPVSRT